MTAPTSQTTIGGVALNAYATLGLRVQYELIGGQTTLRKMDGTGVLQTAWTKTKVTVSATGWAPSELRALDYTAAIAVIVPDPEDSGDGLVTYSCFCQLTEEHDINNAATSWSLVCEEV